MYFLTGTALAGKTTMAEILAEKHGFTHFNEHWKEEHFKKWQSIMPTEPTGENDEYAEFAIIELIKLSQINTVVADVCISVGTVAAISDYNRIACMLAVPELVTCENYGARESHKEYLESIMALSEPEEEIARRNELFRIGVEKTFEDVRTHNLFSIVRTEDSTLEGTLKMLEEHFKLS